MNYYPTTDTQTGSLWLEVLTTDRQFLFELPPNDDRAVVVGSTPRAHVRIDRTSVAPVQFHFEREEDAIFIAPARESDLRVNAIPIAARRQLPLEAVLEFRGVELRTRVLTAAPKDTAPFSEAATAEHVRTSGFEQPLDSATVRAVVPGWATLEAGDHAHTTVAFTQDRDADAPTIALIREPSPGSLPSPDTEKTGAPITERIPQKPATISPREPAPFDRTLVIERPPAPRESLSAQPAVPPVLGNSPPVLAPPTPPQPAPAPEAEPDAAFLETRMWGSPVAAIERMRAAREGRVSQPVLPAQPVGPDAPPAELTPTPKNDVRPEPAPPRAAEFEPAPPAPRLHQAPAAPAALSRSLSETTTAFEMMSPLTVIEASAAPPAAVTVAPPQPPPRPTSPEGWLARLGTQVKARPLSAPVPV